jgi:hypothetical protein
MKEPDLTIRTAWGTGTKPITEPVRFIHFTTGLAVSPRAERSSGPERYLHLDCGTSGFGWDWGLAGYKCPAEFRTDTVKILSSVGDCQELFLEILRPQGGRCLGASSGKEVGFSLWG